MAVHKAVKAGRISLIQGKIDPEVADIQWKKNTDVEQAVRTAGGMASTMQSAQLAVPNSPPNVPNAPDEPYTEKESDGLLAERKRVARLDGDKREDELRKSRGELLEAADVRKEAYAKARMARDVLMNMPIRLAPTLVGKTSKEIEAALREEVRKAISVILASDEASQH